MKKRVLVALLATALTVSMMTGCGSKKTEDTSSTKTEETSEDSDQEAADKVAKLIDDIYALDDEQPDSFTEEEHYWTPYRPYQQNVPNMETDAVKNTTDTVNPDCCTDIDVTDTANNKSPVSLKKDSAAEVSQEDASSQTTNSES